MRKINFILSIFYFSLFLNNNFLQAELQNRVIAKVESQSISSFELKNKIKTILFLTKQEINQTTINSTQREALQALINLKLKKTVLIKYNISTESNDGANKYFKKLASKYNTDAKGLKNSFKTNNIDFNFFNEEIKIELAWQEIILTIYKDQIIVNADEIENELEISQTNKENLESYKLSEIEIILNQNNTTAEKVLEIKDQIKQIGFENTAIKFSSSRSSLDGGDLGWISSKSLSKKILSVVKKMKKGDISQPMNQGGTILFLKLIDKKNEIGKLDIEALKKNIIIKRKNDLLNLFSNNHLSKYKNNALIEIK